MNKCKTEELCNTNSQSRQEKKTQMNEWMNECSCANIQCEIIVCKTVVLYIDCVNNHPKTIIGFII